MPIGDLLRTASTRLKYLYDCSGDSSVCIMDWSLSNRTYMASTNWEAHIKQLDSIAEDRRLDRRYDLNLELRWKLIRRRRILETGTGQTIDFSSGGVLFDTGRAMPVGLNVELAIAWPVLLRNTAKLQLVVSGKIVRSLGSRTAIQMTQHEFRTVGMSGDRRNVQPARPAIDFFSRHAAGAR
jgi:hypothetical protein